MTKQTAPKSAPRFLDLDDLRERGITYHRSHLHAMEQKGDFPRSLKLNEGQFAKRVWVEAEIDQWQREKMAARFTERGKVA